MVPTSCLLTLMCRLVEFKRSEHFASFGELATEVLTTSEESGWMNSTTGQRKTFNCSFKLCFPRAIRSSTLTSVHFRSRKASLTCVHTHKTHLKITSRCVKCSDTNNEVHDFLLLHLCLLSVLEIPSPPSGLVSQVVPRWLHELWRTHSVVKTHPHSAVPCCCYMFFTFYVFH